MYSIRITDNSTHKLHTLLRDYTLTKEDIQRFAHALYQYANTKAAELEKNSPGLFIFPSTEDRKKDGIEDLTLYRLQNYPPRSGNYGDVEIVTGNAMGFLSIPIDNGDRIELTISSRFQQTGGDYFMHYMLSRVLHFNILQLEHQAQRNAWQEFLVYLFPSFLHKAVQQGIISEYRHFLHNDANVRGAINISRHIAKNIPFNGRIAYDTRERTTDNATTQLIRHTAEYLKSTLIGKAILQSAGVQEDLQPIVAATSTYNARARQTTIAQNIRSKIHPYYAAYAPLRKLCMAILRHDTISYGVDKHSICGVMFDGAWMWEEYLYTILKECKCTGTIVHPRNKEHTNGIYLFKERKRVQYPDFYHKHNKKGHPNEHISLIIDAKYKRLAVEVGDETTQTKGNAREDLHQMITYLYITQAKHGIFLHPVKDLDTGNEQALENVLSLELTLHGHGGTIQNYGLRIPSRCSSLTDFVDAIQSNEDALLKHLEPFVK